MQYLNFYIGSDVAREHSETRSDKFFEHGKLVGVSASEVETGKTVAIIDVGLDHFHEWYAEETKLALRQLSSMTEEEAKDFCEKEGWGRDLENIVVTDVAIDFKRVIGTRTETCISRFTRCRPEMFRWLLSKSFDIFNLIPNGLAIDLETIKQ